MHEEKTRITEVTLLLTMGASRNPRAGESIMIPAKTVVKSKASKALTAQ